MPKETATALWLVPDGEAASYFRETIARLTARYDAPVFSPHLTLGLGSAELLEKIPTVPLEVEVFEAACSEEFTKTLFVRFVLSAALAELRELLGMDAAGYDPHLSLLYRELPMREKSLLVDTLALPVNRVRFTAAEATRCALPVSTAADVAHWKTIAHRSLVSPG